MELSFVLKSSNHLQQLRDFEQCLMGCLLNASLCFLFWDACQRLRFFDARHQGSLSALDLYMIPSFKCA